MQIKIVSYDEIRHCRPILSKPLTTADDARHRIRVVAKYVCILDESNTAIFWGYAGAPGPPCAARAATRATVSYAAHVGTFDAGDTIAANLSCLSDTTVINMIRAYEKIYIYACRGMLCL